MNSRRGVALGSARWFGVTLIVIGIGIRCGPGDDDSPPPPDAQACKEAEDKRFGCGIEPGFGCRPPLSPEQRCVVDECILDDSISCEDLSDENLLQCANECFTTRELQCGDGFGTFVAGQRCDGTRDCANGADERGCFVCSRNPIVVANPLVECNGVPECENESDEANCFLCQEDSTPIPPWWRCDGIVDCSGGSDEAECEPFECDDGESIPEGLVCNGVPDCPVPIVDMGEGGRAGGEGDPPLAGAAGENQAPGGGREPEPVPLAADEAACETVECSPGEVIVADLVCDGIGHCEGYEDEMQCE